MIEVITELYIELYWLLYRRFKNERSSDIVDLALLIIFQLANIYSIIALVQKLIGATFTGFLFSQPLLIIVICAIVGTINFLIAREAKKQLREEDKDRFIKRRFTVYAVISLVLLLVARFALGGA